MITSVVAQRPAPSRIALLTTSFPSHPGDPSGHFVATEARRLAREGHEVLVLAPGENRDAPGSDIRVVGLGASVLFGWPGALERLRERPARLAWLLPFLWRAHRELLRRGPFDRAIAHFLVPCGLPLGLVVRAGEIEVVAHGSDVRLIRRVPRPLRTWGLRALLRRGARLRFVSHRLRAELCEGLDAGLAEVILRRSRIEPAPIDLPDVRDVRERAKELRAALTLGPQERLWVVCGRLVRAKRIDRAIALARDHQVRLVVVGDGPLRPELEAFAQRIGAPVSFVGRRPREEALAWIAAADCLLQPSEAEGAPTVVREARCLGTPVLSTPVGDVPHWAETDGGITLWR